MHVLRAEKGFIIVGQETDGSVNPVDLDMNWIVSGKKEFIGKRSLTRADMLKDDRKQLVGILTDDPKEVLPEGAQLVDRVLPQPPMPMIGHVTSSYYSPNLGRSIAMALVKGGPGPPRATRFSRHCGAARTSPAPSPKARCSSIPEGERLRD